MNKNKKIRLVVFVLITIALTLFIFANSLKAGEESSEQSDAVTDLVNRLLSLFGIRVEPGVLSHFIRKLAHFSEYFALGLTSALALLQFEKRFFTAFSPIYCAGIAICDEFVMQAMTEGRAPMWTDVLIDSSGAMTALVIVLCVIIIKKPAKNP